MIDDSKGYIKLFRSTLDWEWWGCHATSRLFIAILLSVNHAPQKWHGIEVKAGQMITSIASLCKTTGLTMQQVRTSLKRLKSTKEITIKTTNKYTLITVVKWEIYQSSNKDSNNQTTIKQQTNNKQITTNKNVKNDKNEKKRECARDKNLFWLEWFPDYSADPEFHAEDISPPFKPDGDGWRLTEDWMLCQAWGEWAEDFFDEPKIIRMAESFKNHHLSRDCKNPIRQDWKTAWQNWVRREI